jgi:hypothetical protein
MKWLWVLALGCVHPHPSVNGEALPGEVDRPYTALPGYLTQPVVAHGLPPELIDERRRDLLDAIDAHAAMLPERTSPHDREALADEIDELEAVLPPKPEFLGIVARMRTALEPLPGMKAPSADEARERLQTLTNLLRIRTR